MSSGTTALSPSSPRQNQLLSAVPGAEFRRLIARLEPVTLAIGEVLCQPGEQLRFAYFPATAIVSLEYELGSDMTAEMVGNEGMVGIAIFMEGGTMPVRAVVRSPGRAYRLKGAVLKEEFGRAGALQRILLRYTQARLTQMVQTVVCNRHHSRDQQLCRWLLIGLDRLPANILSVSQELIACMLGISLPDVTEAAGKLKSSGLVHLDRGRVTVLDRPGLEARVCECYAAVRREFRRLLPVPMAG